jgi:hypothetical protein
VSECCNKEPGGQCAYGACCLNAGYGGCVVDADCCFGSVCTNGVCLQI